MERTRDEDTRTHTHAHRVVVYAYMCTYTTSSYTDLRKVSSNYSNEIKIEIKKTPKNNFF